MYMHTHTLICMYICIRIYVYNAKLGPGEEGLVRGRGSRPRGGAVAALSPTPLARQKKKKPKH